MPPSARVLIVDDSRIFRAALQAALAAQDSIEVVGSVFSGQKALEFIQANPPDVVTLDVEMPGLDGLETLKAIQRFNAQREPGTEVGVIMVSAHTRRGAEVTMRALQNGAFDFVSKPTGAPPAENLHTLQQQLSAKIQLFMAGRSRKAAIASSRRAPPATRLVPNAAALSPQRLAWARQHPARALVVAASTGGPKALESLLPDLRRHTGLPILIVQHMPAGFTHSLAESLSRQSSGTVEAQGEEQVVPGGIYIAPGGKHLLLRQVRGQLLTAINEQPPENGCRPSADVLFRSAAAALPGQLVAIVLTGMGRDGTAGLGAVKRAGGYVIAQDEASSVVWGMPGSAVEAGLADDVLPLGEIAAAVASLVSRNQG